VPPDILHFNEIGKNDIDTAGGKGANLGELVKKGFPVPPGFVITAHVCERFFKTLHLEKEIDRLKKLSKDEFEAQCNKIRSLIEKADISKDLSEAIYNAHSKLTENQDSKIVCAVRSSATAEDLGDASFAGQHATYYYVEKSHLLKMVKHCWASLWNQEAVSYRATQGIDHAAVFMAVVVQEMIPSEISGVTFTANPVTGSRDEIVTESSWGMGAAIVDGRVSPDHYVIDRNGFKLREKRIAVKRFMVPATLSKEKNARLQEVPHLMRRKDTLTFDQAKTVAEWAVRSEEHFGNPQDIEWAIADGRFYILQSRPITIMGREEIGKNVKGKYLIFKPLLENFTEPVTPLTADLLSIEMPIGVRMIRGWAYTNLKLLRLLIPFRISEEEVAGLVYKAGGKPPDMKLSLIRLPLFLLIFFIGYLMLGILFARTRGMPDDFMDGFKKLCTKVENDPFYGPGKALSRLWAWSWNKFFDPIGNMVIMVNVSAPRYMFSLAILENLLKKWVPEVRDDAGSLLCSGTAGVLSAEMGRSIWQMAKEAKRCPAVHKILEKYKPEKVFDILRTEPEAHTFVQMLDRFLARNGHRALKELELRSTRWRENPTPVLGMIRNYLLVDSDPLKQEKKVDKNRAMLEIEIRQSLEKYPLERLFKPRWHLINFLTKQTKYFAKLRENSRFYHIMALEIVRKKILKVEASLIQDGLLRCKDDIFFLKRREIAMLQSGQLKWPDVEDRIRDRRMEQIRLSKMIPPKAIGFQMKGPRKTGQIAEKDSATLLGQSASPGTYEGIAHVIHDPSIDIELKPGEILIAPYTDPAWTPLFLTAGAAVVEVGSYLSHAGTVAREFGMPCVVDVPDCTSAIHTNVRVQVDGDNGIVRIISEDGGDRKC